MRLIELIETDLDYCDLVYGQSPCTAVLGVTGDDKCFNCRTSCQDPDNYTPSPKTYRFLPKSTTGIPANIVGFARLTSVDMTPPKIIPGKAFGQRQSLTARFIDGPHTDRGIDKYVDERPTGAAGTAYVPEQRGTFFGKLRARNLYYIGRPIRYYVGEMPWDDNLPDDQQPAWTEAQFFANLTAHHFIIERFEGPDNNGQFTIIAKDPLKLADDDRAQAPIANTGRLNAAITAGAGSLVLQPTGIGDLEYGTSGKVAISNEIMSYTRTLTSDTLTLTARGVNNTEAKAHSEDDVVQVVLEYVSTRADALTEDLLTNYTKIDPAIIPSTDWSSEADTWLPRLYNVVIPKPTPVRQILDEFTVQAGFDLWSDVRDQEIKLAAIKPPASGSIISEGVEIVRDSVRVKDSPERRISTVWTSFGIIDPTQRLQDSNNYAAALVSEDADAVSDDQYGQRSIKKIHSRFITASGRASAAATNDRLISTFRDIIREITFTVPIRKAQSIALGTTQRIQVRTIQDFTGATDIVPIRILSRKEKSDVVEFISEEQRYLEFITPGEGGSSPDTRIVAIPADQNNVNFRTEYDLNYAPPTATTDIILQIDSGVVVGSTDPSIPAVDIGTWSNYTYNSLKLVVKSSAYIAGKGGDTNPNGGPGLQGGTGLFTEVALDVENNGTIQSGGGSGGSAEAYQFPFGSPFRTAWVPGGGGAGRNGGKAEPYQNIGGPSYHSFVNSTDGTFSAGGVGGSFVADGFGTMNAGDGGGPGLPGQVGQGTHPGSVPHPAGGAAGWSIDGYSLVTYTGTGILTGPTNP